MVLSPWSMEQLCIPLHRPFVILAILYMGTLCWHVLRMVGPQIQLVLNKVSTVKILCMYWETKKYKCKFSRIAFCIFIWIHFLMIARNFRKSFEYFLYNLIWCHENKSKQLLVLQQKWNFCSKTFGCKMNKAKTCRAITYTLLYVFFLFYKYLFSVWWS